MNSYNFIINKQIQWAENEGLKLIGSKITRGNKTYTTNLNDNLFQPLTVESEEEINEGDGGELVSKKGEPSRMQALHSSSAVGINVFQYWKGVDDLSLLTAACNLSQKNKKLLGNIRFERKFTIDESFTRSPNLDVVIEPKSHSYKAFAIECKFTEPYSSRSDKGLSSKYLELEGQWDKLIRTRALAEKLSPIDHYFEFLHASQLIKHILGLTKEYGRNGFRLLYLWYDVYGEAGFKHRNELNEFSEIVNSDGIKFHDMTYQELILRLSEYRKEHPEYIKYLTKRYL